MIIGGLDWSMTTPAICIYDSKKKFNSNNCTFYFYHDNKKYDKSFGKNIHGFKMPTHNSEEERFDNISEWGITVLKQNKVTHACLEGYSMGSKGRIFAIAENIGLLKYKMWKADIKFITPAPTAVKKVFTGKGNAKKEDMYNTMCESNVDLDLPTLLSCASGSSPVADITDSYAMVHYFLNNIDSKV